MTENYPENIPSQIKTAQSLIQEASSHYLMAVITPDGLYWVASDTTAGHGLACRVISKIEDHWHEEDCTIHDDE